MTKSIELTLGQSTIVDDEDYPWLVQFAWHAQENSAMPGRFDVATTICKPGKPQKEMGMGRMLLGLISRELEVDHKNGNPLDNRRNNLRVCTRRQNMWNRRKRKDNKSGYIGVCKEGNKYRADIGTRPNRMYLGGYYKAEDAARVYDKKAKELRGEFAVLNFPEEHK